MKETFEKKEWVQGELFKRNFELSPYKEEIITNLDQLDNIFDWDQEIETLAMNLFGSKDEFISWFLDNTNWREGVPEWFTKIDALKKIVKLDEEIIDLCTKIDEDSMVVLRNLLRYNEYKTFYRNSKTIPLLFSRDQLIHYLMYIGRWDYSYS